MKKPDAYLCDMCGIAKGATNHWLMLLASLEGRNLQITPWDREGADVEGAKHACGNSCTLKLVDRYLQTLITSRAAGGAA
jgi:hypothetical protein